MSRFWFHLFFRVFFGSCVLICSGAVFSAFVFKAFRVLHWWSLSCSIFFDGFAIFLGWIVVYQLCLYHV